MTIRVSPGGSGEGGGNNTSVLGGGGEGEGGGGGEGGGRMPKPKKGLTPLGTYLASRRAALRLQYEPVQLSSIKLIGGLRLF